MSTQLIPYSPFNDFQEEDQPNNIRETWNKYVFHWPLFILCILIALTGAFFYLRLTDNVYEIKAKILIKDDKKIPDDQPALKELNLFKDNKAVENEIEVLHSRKLMQEVAVDLNLWVTYSKAGILPNNELYTNSPVQFTLLEPSGREEKFSIFIKDSSTYILQRENGELVNAAFAVNLNNKLGKWRIDTTSAINNYIGQEIVINVQNPNEAIDNYLEKLEIEPINKLASVVELSIKDNVPQRGEDVLNELIRRYSSLSLENKNRVTKNTLNFIDERLSSLTVELNQAEANVEGFRSSQGLTDISSQSKVFLENVQSNDKLLNEVNVQLNILQGIEQYVNSPFRSGNAPATVGISDPSLINLINKLTDLQLQREKLLAITPESNPVFDPINRQIKITETSIKENINGIKHSLLATRNKLQAYNSRFEGSIKKIPGQERQLLDIKRQQRIKEDLYIYLLQKREELGLSYASTLTESHIVDKAYSGRPVSPKKPLVYAAAVLLGILFPAGLIYGRDVLNNRVKTRAELETNTTVPVISEIMYEKTKSAIVVSENGTYAIGEQFRSLRTNLHYLHNKREKGRVTLLTSSISNEGKSFIANNLAAALAASGRKTILLELDLRRPQILKNLNIPADTIGLTSYLNGHAAKEDIIQPSGVHANLDIIGAGPLPKNPSELLEQYDIDQLFDWLRSEYDDIIMDSPPLHLVTDAMLLARLTDITLYVVRHNYTLKSELQFIEQLNKQNKLPKMGLVFNGVFMDSRYGYAVDYNYYLSSRKRPALTSFTTFFSNRF